LNDIFKTLFGIAAFIAVIGSLLYVMGMAFKSDLKDIEKSN
jgi:hypothetical protein